MSCYWKDFFALYGPASATNEEDLFKQAGHTSDKQPISKEQLDRIARHIRTSLNLTQTDLLLDLCCGNGLLTAELAPYVRHVVGIDFVERNIAEAKRWKSRKNIAYTVGDAILPLPELVSDRCRPHKFLMNHSLAYFDPDQLETILRNVLQHLEGMPFSFLCAGIPNCNLKWNFYNSPQRREKYLENECLSPNTNDGLGRWWSAEEISQVTSQLGLVATITNQPNELSNYRMDALIGVPSLPIP